MDTSEIQRQLSEKPFQSFILRMNDGREFLVTNPEFVSLSRRNVAVMNSRGALVYLEPILIPSMEMTEPTTLGDLPPGENSEA